MPHTKDNKLPTSVAVVPNSEQTVIPELALTTTTKQPLKIAKNGTTILLDATGCADDVPRPNITLAQNTNLLHRRQMPAQDWNLFPPAHQPILEGCLTNVINVIIDDDINLPTLAVTEVEEEPNEKKREEVTLTNEWITHQVAKSDTLTGLSIRYGVTVSQIKKWNKLPFSTRNKIPTKTLQICIDATKMLTAVIQLPDPLEQDIIKLKNMLGLEYNSACYYMNKGRTSFEDALKEAKDDIEWEEKEKEKKKEEGGVKEVKEVKGAGVMEVSK
jgi:hypothetical protein